MRLSFFVHLLLIIYVFAENDWTEKFPTTTPGVEKCCAAYISDQKIIVVSEYDALPGREIYIYDLNANTWTERNPDPTPPEQLSTAVSYIGEDKILLFGGTYNQYYDKTWVYDYSANIWTDMNPSNFPEGRYDHTMAFLGGDKVLLFGGTVRLPGGAGEGMLDDETWIYDLSDNNWTQINSDDHPSARSNSAMAYLVDGKIILFGGLTAPPTQGGNNRETWLFDLNQNEWVQKYPSTYPTGRWRHGMACMGQNQICLFGGLESHSDQDETWIYNFISNIWTLDENGFNPSARRDPNLCETSLNGSSYLVLYGGESGTENFDDTWTFGGGDYSVPVELSFFSAEATNRQVKIKWITQSETNNLGFIIERSFTENGGYIEMASYQTHPELQSKGNSTHPTEYSYTDKNLKNGTVYYYRLIDVDFNGKRTYHPSISAIPNASNNEIEQTQQIASRFYLYQNYPNPFNSSTKIRFELGNTVNGLNETTLIIFDCEGRIIKKLYYGYLSSGVYEINWDGRDRERNFLPSGVYFITLKTKYFNKFQKALLIK